LLLSRIVGSGVLLKDYDELFKEWELMNDDMVF
jgi:hypothetical protein